MRIMGVQMDCTAATLQMNGAMESCGDVITQVNQQLEKCGTDPVESYKIMTKFGQQVEKLDIDMKHIEAGMNMDVQVNEEVDELMQELGAEIAVGMGQGPENVLQKK